MKITLWLQFHDWCYCCSGSCVILLENEKFPTILACRRESTWEWQLSEANTNFLKIFDGNCCTKLIKWERNTFLFPSAIPITFWEAYCDFSLTHRHNSKRKADGWGDREKKIARKFMLKIEKFILTVFLRVDNEWLQSAKNRSQLNQQRVAPLSLMPKINV